MLRDHDGASVGSSGMGVGVGVGYCALTMSNLTLAGALRTPRLFVATVQSVSQHGAFDGAMWNVALASILRASVW
jgi:hypothetical protein